MVWRIKAVSFRKVQPFGLHEASCYYDQWTTRAISTVSSTVKLMKPISSTIIRHIPAMNPMVLHTTLAMITLCNG